MRRLGIAVLLSMVLLGMVVSGCQGRSGDRAAAGSAMEPSGGPPSVDSATTLSPTVPRPRAVARERARPQPTSPVVHSLALAIRGFAASAYVAPAPGLTGPRPVIVLLHGSYDARARECHTWGRVGSLQGWLLCPAGVHRSDVSPTTDRWTWGKVVHLVREIRLGLAALKKRYPGRVDQTRLTLVGFSLGSLLAHEVAYFAWGMFPRLVLVEGVARLRRKWSRRIFRRGVRRVAYVCGETTHCVEQLPKRMVHLERAGIAVRSFVIPGAHHGYGTRFDPVAKRILSWIFAEKRPSEYRLPRRSRRRRSRSRSRSRR